MKNKLLSLFILASVFCIWVQPALAQQTADSSYNINYQLREDNTTIAPTIFGLLNTLRGEEITGTLIYDTSLNLTVMDDFAKYFALDGVAGENINYINSTDTDAQIFLGTQSSAFIESRIRNFFQPEGSDAFLLYETTNTTDNLYVVLRNQTALAPLLRKIEDYKRQPEFFETLVYYNTTYDGLGILQDLPCNPANETDSGDSPFVAGALNNGASWACDKCQNGSVLVEYFCSGNISLAKPYTCEKGCRQGPNGGVCRQETVAPVVTITSPVNNRTYNATLTLAGRATATNATVSFVALNANNEIINDNIPVTATGNFTRQITFFAPGQKNITVTARDPSQNIGTATVRITVRTSNDTTPPITSISSIPSGWSRQPVTVTLTATDTGAGVDKTYYSLNGTTPALVYTGPITISSDGIYTVKYYSQDKAGNKEIVKTASKQVKIDKTAPTGSIIINNGAASTTSPRVALKLSAVDSRSGMGSGAQMCFSIDGSNWSTPVAYATSKTWTFSSVKETKTIYVKFKDVAGNWSIVYSDTIILR